MLDQEHHDELNVVKLEIFWRRTIRKKFVHKTDKTRPPVIAAAPLSGQLGGTTVRF